MKIKQVDQIILTPTAPFNFDATFYKPDHFTSGDNFWQPGIRWQTRRWRGKKFGLKVENKGTVERSKVLIELVANLPC